MDKKQNSFVAFVAVLSLASASNLKQSHKHGENNNRSLEATPRDLRHSSDFVPLVNIPGTKLYTGIYYKLGMKTFPQGWVTWSDKDNWIEIDLDPGSLPKYAAGKEYQYDNQWTFSRTEFSNGYTVGHRGKSQALLIWVNAKAGESGNHVAILDDRKSIAKMSPGGEWRKDALWTPHATNYANHYKLENFNLKGKFLTWTTKKHNEFNYYIQLAKDYDQDSLFKFDPSGVSLEANIHDFQFTQSPQDLLNQNGATDSSILVTKHFPNHSNATITSTFEVAEEMKEQFTFTFTKSFTMMSTTSLSVNFLAASGSTELSFGGGFESSESRTKEVTKTIKLSTAIAVPANSNIEASVYIVWARNVKMPFTAKMKITGFADRILANEPGKVKKGDLPIGATEDLFISSGGNDFEILSRSGNSIIVSVSGTLQGNIGLKSVVSTKNV